MSLEQMIHATLSCSPEKKPLRMIRWLPVSQNLLLCKKTTSNTFHQSVLANPATQNFLPWHVNFAVRVKHFMSMVGTFTISSLLFKLFWVELNSNRFVKYNIYLDDSTVKMLIYKPGEQQFSVLKNEFCISHGLILIRNSINNYCLRAKFVTNRITEN